MQPTPVFVEVYRVKIQAKITSYGLCMFYANQVAYFMREKMPNLCIPASISHATIYFILEPSVN